MYGIVVFMWISTLWTYFLCKSNKSRKDDHLTSKHAERLTTVPRPSSSSEAVLIMCEDLQAGWLILIMMLLRTHNMCLVSLVFIQTACFRLLAKHQGVIGLPSSTMIVLFYWMGQAAFFYQVFPLYA